MRTTRQPRLAKLTRPRLHRAAARERLFSQLDQARAVGVALPDACGEAQGEARFADAAWPNEREESGPLQI